MEGRALLIGTFAPVPNTVGFELPVFRYSTSNMIFIQEIDERGYVTRLSDRSFEGINFKVPEGILTNEGELGIYAFRDLDGVLQCGPLETLSGVLVPLIHAGAFDSRPTLRFRLSALFGLNERVSGDAQAAWEWLEASASHWAADTWKLESTIVPEVQRSVGMCLRASGIGSEVINRISNLIQVYIEKGELHVDLRLPTGVDWADRCRDILQGSDDITGNSCIWWSIFSRGIFFIDTDASGENINKYAIISNGTLNDAKNFLYEKIINPVIVDRLAPPKKINRMRSVKVWISQFPMTGDLVIYIRRFFRKSPEMLPLDLPPWSLEDIYEEFIKKFGHFEECQWSVSDFKEGEKYSGYMVAIFSRIYNNRRGGIYPVGKIGEHKYVLVKAIISGGDYENQWITEGFRMKYYLRAQNDGESKKYDENIPENKSIAGFPDIPVLLFCKTSGGGSMYTYFGMFRSARIVTEIDGSKWFDLVKM